MQLIPTEHFCRMTETGFKLFGISQDTPYLKEFFENQGQKLYESQPGGFFKIEGFRQEMLDLMKKIPLEFTFRYNFLNRFDFTGMERPKETMRSYFFDGYEFPGEYQFFFEIISPAINRYLCITDGKYPVKNPINQILDEIERLNKPSDNRDWEFTELQIRYVKTGLKLMKVFEETKGDTQSESERNTILNLLLDGWAILAEYYSLELFLFLQKIEREFIESLPKSETLCPRCSEPRNDLKDDKRVSKYCEKCRDEIRLERERERQRKKRGTKNIGARYCACGCGEIITGNPKRKYINDTHGRRMQKR